MAEPKTTDFMAIAEFYVHKLRWPIYPLRGIRSDGSCTCGGCKKPGKHPLSRNGKKDATLNLELLEMLVGDEPCPGWATLTGA